MGCRRRELGLGIPPCADLNGLLDLELTRKAVIAWIGVRGSGVQSPGGLTRLRTPGISCTGAVIQRRGVRIRRARDVVLGIDGETRRSARVRRLGCVRG